MPAFRLTRPLRLATQASAALSAAVVFDGASAANAFTLSGPTAGATGVASTFTVTPNGVMASTVTVTPAATNAGSVSPSSLTFTAGSSAAQTFTVTRTTDGTSSVSITNGGGLSNLGTPISFATNAFTWAFSDSATLNTGANTTTTLATGVPPGALYASSPDLLPGQTLQLSGTTLSIVGDSTVPTVNGDSAGSPLDLISDKNVVIEVMDSPIAHIRNATKNIEYPYAATGSWPSHDGQATNRWNWVIGQASAGDVIEISPGAAQAVIADALNYHSNSLDSCGLAVLKPLTIRNMTGRGRWRVWPAGVSGLEANRNGIGVFDPSSMYDTMRGNIVLQGFDITDQFLTSAAGVRLRSPASVEGSWANNHASVTLRNFKIGRTSGASLSGVSGGGAEALTLEDGHVFDCGNGSGQEHNAYISARVMTLRGVRLNRTRGHSSTPPGGGAWDGSVTLEGHILKASAVTGTIEACSFDCATLGDQSHLVQMKAGGNWTLRSNLFIDSKYPMTSRGQINMCREYNADGVTPNFEWWAGSEGNSLVVERNVFIGHYPRPIIGMFDWSTGAPWAMYPPTHPTATAEQKLSTMLVRDNIAMVTSTAANHMQAGFPGTNNAMWINFDPTGGTYWVARGNSIEAYDVSEGAFSNRLLKIYTRTAGTIAANGGTLATQRFLWPHGYAARSDAFQGLG